MGAGLEEKARLIQKGDDAFFKGDRWKAKEYYKRSRECEGDCETCCKGKKWEEETGK